MVLSIIMIQREMTRTYSRLHTTNDGSGSFIIMYSTINKEKYLFTYYVLYFVDTTYSLINEAKYVSLAIKHEAK